MFFNITKQILRGKSLIRSLMNIELKKYKIYGEVADIGGGTNPSYYNFLQKKENTNIKVIDGKHSNINFEKDELPVENNNVDCVLIFNVLEHIYNYRFLTKEIFRIVKENGMVLGFVPFLVNYHPDPNDYFRYTQEALHNIFTEAGFKKINIKAVGIGPSSIGFNTVSTILPNILMAGLFIPCYYFDKLLLKIKPSMKKRYPLGYIFELNK